MASRGRLLVGADPGCTFRGVTVRRCEARPPAGWREALDGYGGSGY